MYPRNAASPERIAVGAIYLIADGTIQTTGASVRVMPQGGAAAGGGGTLACDATSGIWHYIPTQAETNYASFMVLVYKASCTSASATVVTTASATPGTVKLFDGAHGGSSASFAFGAGGTISNASGDALAISATGGNNSGMVLTGSGNGSGLDIASGTSLNANGMTVTSNASSVKGYGLLVTGAVAGAGIRAISSGTGPGMELLGGTNGNALTLTPNGSGYGLSGNIQGNLSGSVGSLTTWHASVTDWTDGGRLDSILDTIAAENGSSFTNIPTQNANMIQINGTTIPGTG